MLNQLKKTHTHTHVENCEEKYNKWTVLLVKQTVKV